MKNLDQRVREKVAEIQQKDRPLGEDMEKARAKPEKRAQAEAIRPAVAPHVTGAGLESAESTEARDTRVGETALETIVLTTGRPVLAIKRGNAQLVFTDRESEVWKDRLKKAQKVIAPAIQAVGRVELANNPRFEWIGTGWLVAEDVIVTNRHVAREFARGSGGGFEFRMGIGGRMAASLDFLEEIDNTASLSFTCAKVLHIEGDDGPDVAFLRLDRGRGKLATPITLATRRAVRDQQVAVIGYPARDSRIPDHDLMDRLFGNVYDKKRLAPGQVTGATDGQLLHDCSTLGGNSGSAIVDLQTGQAVGLHFAGRFLEANFAVSVPHVQERLRGIMNGRPRPRPRPVEEDGDRDEQHGTSGSRTDGGGGNGGGARTATATGSATRIVRTIPIRVTVEVGDSAGDAGGHGSPRATRASHGGAATIEDDDELLLGGLEAPARPEDYLDRDGYQPGFLGDDIEVPLPRLSTARRKDLLTFELNGKTESVLAYRHFSVQMSRSRRLCFYSAVNIDGSRSRKMKRRGWRLDPRIPEEAQIIRESYGSEPKFSRGHMTRREDPIWGDMGDASQGNDDSMHVTNAVPQMQPFNAGIWLGLENYALENARQDDMRISVFTGPFLVSNDPIRYGVKIPRSFWKIIAFVHDETGELCATGYTMSQSSFLREEEFVFGQHETSQVPIATIQSRTGLTFGDLASVDPMADGEEAMPLPLTSFEQVRFR